MRAARFTDPTAACLMRSISCTVSACGSGQPAASATDEGASVVHAPSLGFSAPLPLQGRYAEALRPACPN